MGGGGGGITDEGRTFLFLQFCNFYFCTLGEINECVHSCVKFQYTFTYQVERQLNFLYVDI